MNGPACNTRRRRRVRLTTPGRVSYRYATASNRPSPSSLPGIPARKGRRQDSRERLRRRVIVGVTVFETATSRPQTGRSTKLSYTPRCSCYEDVFFVLTWDFTLQTLGKARTCDLSLPKRALYQTELRPGESACRFSPTESNGHEEPRHSAMIDMSVRDLRGLPAVGL